MTHIVDKSVNKMCIRHLHEFFFNVHVLVQLLKFIFLLNKSCFNKEDLKLFVKWQYFIFSKKTNAQLNVL